MWRANAYSLEPRGSHLLRFFILQQHPKLNSPRASSLLSSGTGTGSLLHGSSDWSQVWCEGNSRSPQDCVSLQPGRTRPGAGCRRHMSMNTDNGIGKNYCDAFISHWINVVFFKRSWGLFSEVQLEADTAHSDWSLFRCFYLACFNPVYIITNYDPAAHSLCSV